MKRPTRREHSTESANQTSKSCRGQAGSKGPWEFTTNGRIFSMGATEAARRAAYRAANGEWKFLPLL
jgi:hypothetical protein